MARKIDPDNTRFRDIIRGKVRKELRKYISHGEMIGRRGKDLISIPVPYVDIPHFRYGEKQTGGVGQGEGDAGTPIGAGPGQKRQGAGDRPADHILETDISLEELAKLLGEELGLPPFVPKRGRKNIVTPRRHYTSIRPVGPEALKHFKRTYKKALLRSLAEGLDPDDEDFVVVPEKPDKLYRSWRMVPQPEFSAAVLYLMDVSGSMMDEQKEIVRQEMFWIDLWIRSHFKGVENRYIVHDALAREVDEYTFYHTRESGGTRISSAYTLTIELAKVNYPADEWVVLVFHFSDGDNWGEDNDLCLDRIGKLLLLCDLVCYGQVKSPYGSGHFLSILEDIYGDHEKIRTSEIKDKDGIPESIKDLLGKGLA